MELPTPPQGRARPATARDGTRLDLDAAPLILDRLPGLRARVRQDLKAICRHVSAAMPEASVLLTGSLSVGEGRCAEGGDPVLLESDYDLVILTPSFLHSLPPVADGKLRPLFQRHRFLAAQEITLAWEPLLKLGMTTTAGKVVSDGRRLDGVLENLPAPRAAGALEGAYCSLAAVPMAPAVSRSALLSRACVKAFQAFFLERWSAAPRHRWAGLSSIRFIRERVEDDGQFFSFGERELLRRSAAHLLREKKVEWGRGDQIALACLLDRIRRHIRRPFSRRGAVKHAAWVLRTGGGARRLFSRAVDSLHALQLLAESWGAADAPRRRALMAAAGAVGGISAATVTADAGDPKALYAKLYDILNGYVSFYPNKLYYPGGSRPESS